MASATPQEKFLEVWNEIDKVKLTEAILAGCGPKPDFDVEDVGETLVVAAERWLVDDLEQIDLRSVEQEHVTQGFKFVVDMDSVYTGRGTKLIQYDDKTYAPRAMTNFAGKRVIHDWKTTGRELDARWQDGLIDSWQWRDYLAETGADIFVYRGIKRRKRLGDEVETREFAIDRSYQPDLQEVHAINLRGIHAQVDALIDLQVAPWPQHRPDACRRFGRLCAFKDDCDSGLQFIPTGNLTKGRALSYSRIGDFTACPELHRRRVLAKMAAAGEDDSGPDAAFGSAMHKALANVYEQAFKLLKTND